MFEELAFRARSLASASLPAFKRTMGFEQALALLPRSAQGEARALAARFKLDRWATCCAAQDWRESLYALEVVSRLIPGALPSGRAMDVGAKNGAMLAGLATAIPRGWDAVELDAHRRYLWGSTRRVYGEAMARAFPDCRYIPADGAS